MTALARLHEEGRRLISEELMRGSLDRPPDERIAGLIDPFDRKLELDAFDDALDRTIRDTSHFDTTIDAIAAPLIHRALTLTRREAAEPGVWRFLTIVHRPDFVRHRWEYRARSTMTSRFWGFGTRPDSNAVCRLWWIAELSVDGTDYGLTERALSSQTAANSLFVRSVSSYRPAVEAFLDIFGGSPAQEVERGIKQLSAWLSVVPLEGRSADELREALVRIRDQP